jgi:hypothetical protein
MWPETTVRGDDVHANTSTISIVVGQECELVLEFRKIILILVIHEFVIYRMNSNFSDENLNPELWCPY